MGALSQSWQELKYTCARLMHPYFPEFQFEADIFVHYEFIIGTACFVLKNTAAPPAVDFLQNSQSLFWCENLPMQLLFIEFVITLNNQTNLFNGFDAKKTLNFLTSTQGEGCQCWSLRVWRLPKFKQKNWSKKKAILDVFEALLRLTIICEVIFWQSFVL